MTLANQLTLARIVAVIPLMAAIYIPFPGSRWVVLAIYVAARRSNKVTGFGKLMDSIADKALIVSLFFALVGEGLMPSWMAAVMVIREFAVTGLRMVALESGQVIAANGWGKAKMNSQSLAIFVILVGFALRGGTGELLTSIGWWLMFVAVILTLISGWSYLKDTPRILSVQSERDQRL
jgi:CDP-diacylglycerol--glycerol-3-phosphate 3-phosphatidyltransferase